MKITCTLRPQTADLLRRVSDHTGLLPEDLALAGIARVIEEVVTHGWLVYPPDEHPPGKAWKPQPTLSKSSTSTAALTR